VASEKTRYREGWRPRGRRKVGEGNPRGEGTEGGGESH
jgi:hypothetical protein